MRTVGRTIGDYDDFIGVERVRLLLESPDYMSQSGNAIVGRYYNPEVGVGCLHGLALRLAIWARSEA